MRVRVRGPAGQSTITLSDTATVGDLLFQLSIVTSIDKFEIKYGYPPKPLPLDEFEASMTLSATGVHLDGEQLIVSEAYTSPNSHKSKTEKASNSLEENNTASNKHKASAENASSFSFAGVGAAPQQPSKPLSLSRKTPSTEPPELALPSHGSTLLLRIMPDDNSCLFRAFGGAFFGLMDNMTELRSIIAQNIQANPEKYPTVVLERSPDNYCRWIQTEDAWGGAIELDILSRHFDIEICSIDVQTLRVDRFNEGRPTRCILVYSGIHYDTIALSPADPPYDHAYAPPDFDTKVFDAADEVVLHKAVELCKILQSQHYFTDTSKFSIRCNVCKHSFTGEKGATEHAKETGHYDFGEAA